MRVSRFWILDFGLRIEMTTRWTDTVYGVDPIVLVVVLGGLPSNILQELPLFEDEYESPAGYGTFSARR